MIEHRKEQHRKGKIILNTIFVIILIVSACWFFQDLFESITISDANDDIFGSHGNAFIAVIIYGPVWVILYAIYRLIRLLAFKEVILSFKVKCVRDIVIIGGWFVFFLMEKICRSIEMTEGFQKTAYLRDYVYFELARGMMVVFVPAYILAFIGSKLIKMVDWGEDTIEQ